MQNPLQPAESTAGSNLKPQTITGLLGPVIPAALVLADGTVFHGRSIGAPISAVGEVVFNTSMSGYQEILTDPSYSRQLVTLTYPHIGSTGITREDDESTHIHCSGLIIKDLPRRSSNWREEQSLQAYLEDQNIPGIADIDTRKLTRLLRTTGAQNGCLLAGSEIGEALDIAGALHEARGFAGLAGMDLAKVVSVGKPYMWTEGTWTLALGHSTPTALPYHVVAFDYGVKRNILRMLVDRGCKVTVLPAQATAQQALALAPDGIFLSNGPGDPEPCDYAIAVSKTLIEMGIPTFGICLGHQIMGLASGATTLKMKFGHHGANHPVKDHDTGKVLITSQNHGFAVNPNNLPSNMRITHTSLFDGTIQGLARTDKPAFCFQGHPEASPGPHDIGYLFDRFVALIKAHKKD